jgi:hypothetical protein
MTVGIVIFLCLSLGAFIILSIKKQSSKNHEYAVTEQFNVLTENLWEIITNYENQPKWRSDLIKVEKVINKKGSEIWKETDIKKQQIEWESFIEIRNRKLVRKTVSENIAVNSIHIYELKPYGEVSLLTLIEITQVDNVFLRWIKYMFMSQTSELSQYVKDLRIKINNDAANKTSNI